MVSRFRELSFSFIAIRYRWLRRLRFRYLRLLIFLIFRLWVKQVHGFENIPRDEPAIIVSNHLSYVDFWVLSAILKEHTVFVAVKNLDKRSVVGWTMRLDIIVYVDREKPGPSFFRELIWHLKKQRRLIVVYPEGTRSRTGRMLTPKPGFVKLAIKTGVPIIPIAMKGTFEILPPHKQLPRLKKCDVFIGDKIYISPQNPEFHDIFFRRSGEHRRYEDLDDAELQEIAFRIMEKVRVKAGQEWDESVIRPKLDVPEEVIKKHHELMLESLHESSSSIFRR
ncbi:MAG: 1-acyl-sn-glycerol-3-phosphate acyltransferase [Candidatus Omnitrophica bacterium]|nr:1-acyl-sn-glycerol-3-phosphate acyltransferase [Candidatus Omnitrophota bacterium]